MSTTGEMEADKRRRQRRCWRWWLGGSALGKLCLTVYITIRDVRCFDRFVLGLRLAAAPFSYAVSLSDLLHSQCN